MKLLTLNCHSWQEENQLDKIQYLAKTIKEKSYDVIALQEVSQLIAGDKIAGTIKKDNYLTILLNELKVLGVTNYDYMWDFSHIGFDKYEEGLAILTKHRIEEKSSFYISLSDDPANWKTRKIVGVKIRYNNEYISFYSCHLGWWGDEEEPFPKQVDNLLANVTRDGTFYLMGDFNNSASVKAEGYDYLLSKGLYDTYELAIDKDSGTTVEGKITGWDTNKQDLRIDYIFTNKQTLVNKSNVIFNNVNKPIISDHFGIDVESIE
ncbi:MULTISPECIES: endonuclease/exonuclease/phosphatase family protein [Metabacillus]|uniref:Endonuclease n=2 Tax=Metabacillus TaxID=2675233 RepID=A0A179SQP9_9BACI|nr:MULTISPECIES: endonuclease/exonuclease/phosphatase family protein [Metabacillus]OAS83199.1 endonuclease [Metabacillus litoralis]QNF29687.1 endonuclease/exonuclease/phosphatase family protein [Metabacillus sp. KUDC1714]